MKFKFFTLFILVLIVPAITMCQSQQGVVQSAEVVPTPVPPLGTKLFSGGTVEVGRTEEEAVEAFELCVDIIESSNRQLPVDQKQDVSEICQLNFFDDVVPPRTVNISPLYWDKMESVSKVTTQEAEDLCKAKGGRLPTIEENEYLGGVIGSPKKDEANLDWEGGNPKNPIAERCEYPAVLAMCDVYGRLWEWVTYINPEGDIGYAIRNGCSGTVEPFWHKEQFMPREKDYKAGYRCVYEVSK